MATVYVSTLLLINHFALKRLCCKIEKKEAAKNCIENKAERGFGLLVRVPKPSEIGVVH